MLAERLLELRSENNKTQKQVADYLKITRPAYTAYERGTRQPDYETLKKLASFFNVTTDYLLGNTDEKDGQVINEEGKNIENLIEDPQLGLWFKAGKETSPENRKRALDFLKFIEEEEKGRKPGDKQNK
jgi:transcriptional regulator with XRE-family HTH domain